MDINKGFRVNQLVTFNQEGNLFFLRIKELNKDNMIAQAMFCAPEPKTYVPDEQYIILTRWELKYNNPNIKPSSYQEMFKALAKRKYVWDLETDEVTAK